MLSRHLTSVLRESTFGNLANNTAPFFSSSSGSRRRSFGSFPRFTSFFFVIPSTTYTRVDGATPISRLISAIEVTP